MKNHNGVKQIDPRTWRLLKTAYLHFIPNQDKKTASWRESEIAEPQETLFGVVRSYRNTFGRETIYLRSTTIFEKGPYIQFWWSDSENQDLQLNRIIKINNAWQKLESHETIRVDFMVNNKRVVGVIIKVTDRTDKNKIHAEIRIGRTPSQT